MIHKPTICRQALRSLAIQQSVIFLIVLLFTVTRMNGQTVTYSETFTSGVSYTASDVQWTHWTSFISQLTPRTYSSVTIKGSNDATGVTVTDPAVATAIANALYTNAPGSWTSGGRTWAVGACGSGLELSATGSVCGCPNPGYIVRPHIANQNWGGVNGPTCDAGTQTLTVVFVYSIYTFTTAGVSGRLGPSQAQVNSAYTGTSLAGNVTVTTQGIQEWTVPVSGTYKIETYGAQGGNSYSNFRTGGYGAYTKGEFSLSSGQVLKVIVGQTAANYYGSSQYEGGGGGGGSFVWLSSASTPMIAAGGGGGGGANQGTAYNGNDGTATTSGSASNGQYVSAGGTSGGGGEEHSTNGEHAHGGSAGGGWLSAGASAISGADGGASILDGYGVGGQNGSASGQTYGSDGGFGGGGGAVIGGGGGGGYSGGGAGNQPSGSGWIENGGGGGGSYNAGSSQVMTAGSRAGNGTVIITKIADPAFPANPTSVTASANPICNGFSTLLTANGAVGTVYWYTGSCGGTQVGTGATFTVSPTTTTTYYARNYNNSQFSTGCASLEVTVNQPSYSGTAPTVASLQATGTGIKWYASSSGGSQLATSTTLVNGNHYYASQTVNGNESTTRVDVTASFDPTPCKPTGSSSQTYSAGATVASLQATGSYIRWYAGSSGGTALSTSTVLVNGTHYYATQTVSCTESASRFDITVTIN